LNSLCPGSGLQSIAIGNPTVADAFNVPLGDLISIIASYDVSAGYSSNELAFYFTTICGGAQENNLITKWLNRTGETMSGSYGSTIKKSANLGYDYTYDNNQQCKDTPDTLINLSNTLSPFTMAELLKHIVLYREIPIGSRLPIIRWVDLQDIIYGSSSPVLFPITWGGLSTDISIYLQSAFGTGDLPDFEDVKNKSLGKWRIFSKLGDGYTYIRNRTETVYNAYGSFPVFNETGGIVPNQGLELIFSGKFWIYGDNGSTNIYGPVLDQYVHQYVSAVVQQIYRELQDEPL